MAKYFLMRILPLHKICEKGDSLNYVYYHVASGSCQN